MTSINSNTPDLQYKLKAFDELTHSIKKSGISFAADNAPESLLDALGFIIETTQEIYGNKWKFFIQELIKDINQIGKSTGEKAACEISWKLDRKVELLLQSKLAIMTSKDKEKEKLFTAIFKLYQTVNRHNERDYTAGLPVHFGGVPGALVPGWCKGRTVILNGEESKFNGEESKTGTT